VAYGGQRIPKCSGADHFVDGEEETNGAYAINTTLALARPQER
jgi:hypothetical protein